MASKDKTSHKDTGKSVNDADTTPPRSHDPEQVKKKADQQQQDLQHKKPSKGEAQNSKGPKEDEGKKKEEA